VQAAEEALPRIVEIMAEVNVIIDASQLMSKLIDFDVTSVLENG
jgi:hypothetical protein